MPGATVTGSPVGVTVVPGVVRIVVPGVVDAVAVLGTTVDDDTVDDDTVDDDTVDGTRVVTVGVSVPELWIAAATKTMVMVRIVASASPNSSAPTPNRRLPVGGAAPPASTPAAAPPTPPTPLTPLTPLTPPMP